METVGTFRAGAGRVDVAKTVRNVAIAKDRLGKKIVALGLRDSLPDATIDRGVIAKLEED